jgi:protein-disulfide isomerase
MAKSPIQILLIALLVASAFAIGSLWTKVSMLEKGGAIGGSGKNNQAAVNPSPTEVKVDPVGEGDHVRGDRNARIALIEYSDLECPFCKQFHKTAQRVVDEYDGKVMWVYRHFPLDNLHSKADKEAEAAECAGEIGGENGFGKMVDKIFEVTPSNNGLNLDDLPKLAEEVGIDQAKFQECLAGGKFAGHVEDDYQSGLRAGVNGTPGNILLDVKTGKTRVIPGAVPLEQVKTAIDAML